MLDVFNGWTFKDVFPALQQTAANSYHALSPIAYLVMGAVIAGIAIEVLLRVVWTATHNADKDD